MRQTIDTNKYEYLTTVNSERERYYLTDPAVLTLVLLLNKYCILELSNYKQYLAVGIENENFLSVFHLIFL